MDGRRIAKKIAYFVAAGALACLVFQIVFMQPGIIQGKYTVLTSDLNGQYVNYLLYFRDAILNHKGLFYTFSGLLGTETVALIGYYLLSPLNILVLIFPAEKIATAVFWIVLSKVTLAGVTAALFFGRKNDYRWSGLIFSTTYAASGYIFAYFMHIMWLDSVYMLTLVAIVQIIMLCINGMSYMGVFRFDDYSTEGYYREMKPVIQEIQSRDKGLYRLEKAFLNSSNDGMMLSYAGFSFFSSSDKVFIRNFMGDLGYNQNYHWVYYD